MPHGRWIALLLLAAMAGSGHAATPAAEAPTVVPLTPYLGAIPSLELTVGGEKKRFLLDTAGGVTVGTPAFAEGIGCTPWGRITGHRMRGDRLDGPRCDDVAMQLAAVSLQLPSILVWDFSTLLPPGAPPLAGSLALDALEGRAVTLDLGGGELIVETAASLAERVRGATEVPVRFAREAQGLALVPFVAVETPRGRLWMELDTGSTGAMIIDRHAAQVLGLDADAKAGQPATLELAGGIPVEGKVRIEDLIIDGNIGAPVLRRWQVTIDLANERLWIKPRPQQAADAGRS